MTRPTLLLLAPLFAVEALRCCQRGNAEPSTLRSAFAGVELRALLSKLVRFGLPLLAIGLLAMWMNHARFDDPFEFGHTHLQIRWRARIEKWGLFNYHYLGRNLAVMLATLPWLSSTAPFLKIGRHGLALWVTTPHLLAVLWPKKSSLTMLGLVLAALGTALLSLLYQNSGWIQFGYRFSLDYAVLLFALLALGGRRFGKGFVALFVLAVAINLFGAITFDRVPRYYDQDSTQRVIFQPD
jgi:hypothetical protein